MLRLLVASITALLLPSFVCGDVKFTAPSAGAYVQAGTINVQWQESNVWPPIADLTAYTLVLMTGGNDEDNMLALSTFVSQGNFASGNSQQGTIPSGIAGPVNNGFFFKILSSGPNGTVINYSDRFSITGLTGSTPSQYRDAATGLDGSSQGPDSVGDYPASSSSSSVPTTTIALGTTASTKGAEVTVTAEPTSTPATSNKTGNGSSISTGALVGIAIAGAVVGLLGVGLALWVCLRRRKRTEEEPTRQNSDAGLSTDVLHRKEMTVITPVELDPNARIVEADEGTPPAEMDSNAVRAELEGDIHHTYQWRTPLTPVPDTPLTTMTLDLPTPLEPGTPVTPRSNV